ncbi:MAG: A24 family peptidase [Nanoarchaeota archaeon]
MNELVLVVISLIWLFFASYTDFKIREVPDWISYSLIIIGIAFYLIKSLIFNNFIFIIQSLFSLLILYLIGSLMYYLRQWGGGDVKLLSAIGALFPVYPEELLKYFNPNLNLSFILILILNIIIFGVLYSIIYSFYLVIKNKNKIKFNFKVKKIYLISSILFLILTFLIKDLILKLLILLLALLILIYPYIKNFVSLIEKNIMIKRIPLNKLTEGDWVIENIYYKRKLIYNKNNPGVTNSDIKLFEKVNVKNLLIKEGLPFIPSFLIALLISLILGNLLRI